MKLVRMCVLIKSDFGLYKGHLGSKTIILCAASQTLSEKCINQESLIINNIAAASQILSRKLPKKDGQILIILPRLSEYCLRNMQGQIINYNELIAEYCP